MFGKPWSAYWKFQAPLLVATAVVGIGRLALSLGGAPNTTARWASVTVISLIAFLAYGVLAHTRGFGTYKHLLPLCLNQNVVAHGIVMAAIALSIVTGQPNIFSAPEYSGGGDGRNWTHFFAHAVIGMGAFTIIGWGFASLAMAVTKLARRGAPQPSA